MSQERSQGAGTGFRPSVAIGGKIQLGKAAVADG